MLSSPIFEEKKEEHYYFLKNFFPDTYLEKDNFLKKNNYSIITIRDETIVELKTRMVSEKQTECLSKMVDSGLFEDTSIIPKYLSVALASYLEKKEEEKKKEIKKNTRKTVGYCYNSLLNKKTKEEKEKEEKEKKRKEEEKKRKLAELEKIKLDKYKNSNIVGLTLCQYRNDKKLYIVYSLVRENYRGKKLNHRMLDSAKEKALEQNIMYMVSNIRIYNTSSLRSFINFGFKINKSDISNYKNGEYKIRLYMKLISNISEQNKKIALSEINKKDKYEMKDFDSYNVEKVHVVSVYEWDDIIERLPFTKTYYEKKRAVVVGGHIFIKRAKEINDEEFITGHKSPSEFIPVKKTSIIDKSKKVIGKIIGNKNKPEKICK